MKCLPHLALAIASLLLCAETPVRAQTPSDIFPQQGSGVRPAALFNDAVAGLGNRLVGATEPPGDCDCCAGSGYQRRCPACCFGYADPGLYVGAEYLLIRPHFSEAIAFAQGTQTPTTLQTEGRELQFDYDSSFRIFVGYRRGYGDGELRFTYWHSYGDISVDGTAEAGEFLVDPFGNLVGTATVVNPHSALAGVALPGGDLIRTRAIVETNTYDLDLIKPILLSSPNWLLSWSVGVRIADIDQYYESVVTLADMPFASGDFSADFTGAGPRLGFEARRYFGERGRFAVFVNGHAALLVGEDQIQSSNDSLTLALVASQQESLTRTIPVTEAELGVSWRIRDSLNLSLGWLFHAWFDMGTSGGEFGGFFAGADDTNLMSFDGLFLNGEWTF